LTSQFESIVTGVAGHIGNYADAVAVADRFSRYPRLCRGAIVGDHPPTCVHAWRDPGSGVANIRVEIEVTAARSAAGVASER
jgi:hypothetical protein